MEDRKWTTAGWMAIAAAALIPPNLLLSFLADTVLRRHVAVIPVTFFALAIGAISTVLSLIALYRFRQLLNERLHYHGVDTLVLLSIVGVSTVTVVGTIGRSVSAVMGLSSDAIWVKLVFVVPIVALGAALGIISIVYGAKLFGLDSHLQGLMRPYAILAIVSGACFVLVVLAPLAMLLMVAENVILALMFFRVDGAEAAVEFV